MSYSLSITLFSFFFNDTATTEIYTLSLHDALPISRRQADEAERRATVANERLDRFQRERINKAQADAERQGREAEEREDRKSTRLNSSHANISYAVFCLKKKKKQKLPN